jgi:hypothetical protein
VERLTDRVEKHGEISDYLSAFNIPARISRVGQSPGSFARAHVVLWDAGVARGSFHGEHSRPAARPQTLKSFPAQKSGSPVFAHNSAFTSVRLNTFSRLRRRLMLLV